MFISQRATIHLICEVTDKKGTDRKFNAIVCDNSHSSNIRKDAIVLGLHFSKICFKKLINLQTMLNFKSSCDYFYKLRIGKFTSIYQFDFCNGWHGIFSYVSQKRCKKCKELS